MFPRGYTEFIVEDMTPDLLHIVPVSDDTVLDGVLEGEDTSLALGLITDVGRLLSLQIKRNIISLYSMWVILTKIIPCYSA